MAYLRYRRDHPYGRRWPTVRYPARGAFTREKAEEVRAAMPEPDVFEIVEED